MAKVTIRNVEKARQKFKEIINKAISDQGLRLEIGNLIIDDIKGKTRLGKIPKTGQPIKGLADSTIKTRGYLAKYNPVHKTYKQRKSNLTITGQLLDSIKLRIPEGITKIFIDVTGNRTPYKTKKGELKNPPTNKELEEFHRKDRPFMGISESIIKRSRTRIIRFLRRMIRKI